MQVDAVDGRQYFCARACRKAWSLVKEESVFVDWQRVKVQENSDEVCQRFYQSLLQRTLWPVLVDGCSHASQISDSILFFRQGSSMPLLRWKSP